MLPALFQQFLCALFSTDGEHTHLLCFHIKPDAKPIPGNDLLGISGPNYLVQFFLKLAGVKIAPDGLCCVKWMDIGVIRFKVKQPGPVDTDSAAEAGPFIPNDPAELIGHVPVDDHYMGAASQI